MTTELPAVPELPASVPVHVYYPFYVAMIIDGVVHDVLNVDGQTAARYLAQPTFVQIAKSDAGMGWVYDAVTGTFSYPEGTEVPEGASLDAP